MKNMIDASFLNTSQSVDIEDQSECSQFTAVSLEPRHHSTTTFHPHNPHNLDKNPQQTISASSQHGSPSSSQITSELIEQLLRLRAAAVNSDLSVYHQSETRINSCVNDAENSSHVDEPAAAPCLQSLDNADEVEEEKLFVL